MPGELPPLIVAAMLRAVVSARPVMAANFVHADWRMAPAEFMAFWGASRLVAVATVGDSGWPHAAPVEASIAADGHFVVPAFRGSVRARDLAANPRLVLTTWEDAWHAAIVYGRVEGEDITRMRPARIYAMRAPPGHHAWRGA